MCLLLSSKELACRDAPKRDIDEQQKEANRRLELEIKDLNGLVNAQLAMANLPGSRMARLLGSQPQPTQFKPKEKARNMEPER